MYPIETAYKIYTGRDGKALNNGYVYFGTANQNPITSPITVYWDAAGTQPAAQPLRTENGYIVRSGTPSNVFVTGSYSQLVQDAKKRQVFYAKNSTEFSISASADQLRTDLAATTGAGLVGWIRSTAGAVATTLSNWLGRQPVSVFDFMTPAQIADVQSNTGSIDVTAAWQAAFTHAAVKKRKVLLPSGTHLITDSMQCVIGTFAEGEKMDSYNNGYSVAPLSTTIKFSPTVAGTDLFVASGTSYGGFRFHYGFKGMHIIGNANARYAFNLDHVIYGNFSNITIDAGTFNSTFFCNGTIGNKFSDVFCTGTVQAVTYAGNNETTDDWDNAKFFGSPGGVAFGDSSINIRFNNCLWEQLDTFGMQIAKACQLITVVDGYCEDVPYQNTATAAMFKIGNVGTSGLSSEAQLTIIGGKYSGRNAGTVGSFIDADYCSGVIVQGVTHSRFTTIIKTTANTVQNSIRVSGCNGVGWTTYANDYTKISGAYPNGVNNSGTPSLEARYLEVKANTLTAADGNGSTITLSGSLIQLSPGAGNAVYPSGNGVVNLGLSSQKWATVYAATGAINTSDERQKQQIKPIDDAALRAWSKVEFRQFRFNDAVAIKGDGARWHFGVIAQRVKDAFESEGINPFEYGVLCYDEWDAQYEDVFIEEKYIDEDGKEQSRFLPGTPRLLQSAGSAYGVRYEEAMILECAYLRSRLG